MDKSAAHLIVRGRVQGVFFRVSAQEVADSLNLQGWARNCSDGSVEILAQGDPKKLDKFIEWCRKGPASASVTQVDLDWVMPEETQSFVIK